MAVSQNGWRANDRSLIVSISVPGGKLANEGTTIGMYRHIADREEARRKEAEAELVRVKRELRWYRSNYASIWQTYKVGPPPGERDFPFGPPEDLN